MGKVVYRKSRKRARRNPTLLTLVNPTKGKGAKSVRKMKKKSKPKAKPKAKMSASVKKQLASAKRQVTAAKKQTAAAKKQATSAKKSAKKATATAKQMAKATAEVKKALKSPRKYGWVGVGGKQTKKTRKWKTKSGKKVTAKSPDRGFWRVGGHDRGESGVKGYWRFQPNSGGTMRRKRRAAPKRRRATKRPARRTSPWSRNPRRAKRATPKRKRPMKKRASPKRKRPSKKRAAPKRARRKSRKSAKRNPRRRRAAPKRKVSRRRKYKSNPMKPATAAKQAVAGFAGFLLNRVVNNVMARHVAPMLPLSVQPMASLLGTGAGVLAAYYLPKKVKKIGPISLKKYQTALLVGSGVAFLDVLFNVVAPSLPQGVLNYLAPPAPASVGGGVGAIWPQSFMHEAAGFASTPMLHGRKYGVQMAEYVQSPMGEYVQDMGEYVSDDLDAGVISDGLYGDPGDDDIDIEVLD